MKDDAKKKLAEEKRKEYDRRCEDEMWKKLARKQEQDTEEETSRKKAARLDAADDTSRYDQIGGSSSSGLRPAQTPTRAGNENETSQKRNRELDHEAREIRKALRECIKKKRDDKKRKETDGGDGLNPGRPVQFGGVDNEDGTDVVEME